MNLELYLIIAVSFLMFLTLLTVSGVLEGVKFKTSLPIVLIFGSLLWPFFIPFIIFQLV